MIRAGSFFDDAERIATGPEDHPINVSRFNHVQIVEGLHRLLHSAEPRTFARPHLRVAHGDGSESVPFPLRHLGPAPEWDVTARPLRVGFVSGRHPEMDRVVDYYLARNRELRLLESSADQEQEVYERAVGFLRELAAEDGCALEVYHTGLELVTVAFYRAVVEAAPAPHEAGRGRIVVQPRIWMGGRVDVAWIIDQSRGVLEPGSVITDLRALIASFPEYLAIEAAGDGEQAGPVSLHWLPERPMLSSEFDWISRRARGARLVIEALYRRAQYRCLEPWRTG